MIDLEKIKNIIRYKKWKIFNPGLPYHEYYVHNVSKRIDRGLPHCTLGNLRADERYFNVSAKIQLDFLIKQCLKKYHKVLDYGCGSLRLGRLLIEYLDTKKYYGADVTEKFYKVGLKSIDSSLVNAKRPQFFLIQDSAFETIKSLAPDFTISTGVLMHVPLNELEKYFSDILSVSDKGRVYISFTESSEYKQIGEMTWLYPTQLIKEKIHNAKVKIVTYTDEKDIISNKFIVIEK